MIVTFLFIVAFIRSKPWRRERQAAINLPSKNNINIVKSTYKTTCENNSHELLPNLQQNNDNSTLAVSAISLQRRRSLKTHEVTFSGSVVGGSTDSETPADKQLADTSTAQSRESPASSLASRRPSTPESTSSSSMLYRSFTSSVSAKSVNSTEHCDNVLAETSRRLLRRKRIYSRFNTVDVNMDDPPQDTAEGDAEDDVELEDDSYDRDTEEFYSHIQDATGTTSASRSKRSSLFSRSDSSATTTSSSGTFTGKRRSAASIVSSSICSDVIPLDRRRSSTATDYSTRSGPTSQRRSSGRVRRYISRMTIAGARRRTTGRLIYIHTKI